MPFPIPPYNKASHAKRRARRRQLSLKPCRRTGSSPVAPEAAREAGGPPTTHLQVPHHHHPGHTYEELPEGDQGSGRDAEGTQSHSWCQAANQGAEERMKQIVVISSQIPDAGRTNQMDLTLSKARKGKQII